MGLLILSTSKLITFNSSFKKPNSPLNSIPVGMSIVPFPLISLTVVSRLISAFLISQTLGTIIMSSANSLPTISMPSLSGGFGFLILMKLLPLISAVTL